MNPVVDRETLWHRLRGCFVGDPRPGTLPGGRTAALGRLHQYDPTTYGRTRNHLDAPVSRLSPYLRHGMLLASEVRDSLKTKFTNEPALLEEFLRQLAWRDFFEKVLAWHDRNLQNNLEEPKHHVNRTPLLPLNVQQGHTGLPCIDGMLHELFEDGYLHNHARLWFAAYLCHFRGVQWQAGAALFRQYLYDGDFASNSSSWQWVEGTFASKPYFMNQQNIANFSQSRWCATCRVACPFDSDYPSLQRQLFEHAQAPLAIPGEELATPLAGVELCESLHDLGPLPSHNALVWVHDAALSWTDLALTANPTAAVAFVFDEPTLRAEPWAFHRLAFVMDGLDDLFAHLPNRTMLTLVGSAATQLANAARSLQAKVIHVSEHPNPTVKETVEILKSQFEVVVHPRPIFAEYTCEPKRFSRYWEKVAPQVLGYRPSSSRRMHQ